jgi:hypothetical protein
MHMILRYPSGRRVDGILLAAGPTRLRIVVQRLNETLELHLSAGQWTTEEGNPVEVDGLLTDGHRSLGGFCSHISQRVSTATH